MTLRDTVNLIPRNNWDDGWDALLSATAAIYHHVEEAPNVANLFQQDPIWTNAGRTSLYAILVALELPAGSEVGVPLFCCSVVFDAIAQAGLRPRFIDSNTEDYNLSVEDLRNKRSDLAAVIPVHMFGKPADMDAINDAANGIPVIEDCAQAILSTYRGRPAGLLSTVSFFSFRCGKYISAGEGSAIICKDPELHGNIKQVADSFEPWSGPKMFTNAVSTFVKASLVQPSLVRPRGSSHRDAAGQEAESDGKGRVRDGEDRRNAACAHQRANSSASRRRSRFSDSTPTCSWTL